MIGENGVLTEEFSQALPEMLGDNYYNDPETKQQPTKMFENIKDIKSLVNMAATAQRKATQDEAKYAEKYKGMVKVPEDGDSPEVVTAFRKASGVPDSVEDYQLAIPDGDDKATYENIADVVKNAAIEAGCPTKVLNPIWNKVVEVLGNQIKELESKGLALMQQDEQTLKNEKKEKYDAFVKTGDEVLAKLKNGAEVKKVLETFGLDKHPAIRKMLGDEIAPLVLEGETVAGEVEGGTGDEWPVDYSYAKGQK